MYTHIPTYPHRGVGVGGVGVPEHDMQGVVGIGGAKSMRFWGQKILGKNF